ncbi:MAG TPA: hypothetical protein V6D20_24355 [Candidatus Obscuribacterales bacterium]
MSNQVEELVGLLSGDDGNPPGHRIYAAGLPATKRRLTKKQQKEQQSKKAKISAMQQRFEEEETIAQRWKQQAEQSAQLARSYKTTGKGSTDLPPRQRKPPSASNDYM